MKTTIPEIRKEIEKLTNKIWEIEHKEAQLVQIPYLKSLIGTCYVYKDNSYGGNSEKWDVFRKILDYVETEESFYFIYEEISIDSYGKISFLVDYHSAYLNPAWHKKLPFSGYILCSITEYNIRKENILEEMRSQKKLRKHLKS